jgi:hypothetical protein
MSSTLTDLTAATTWSGTDLFYALVAGNSRKIAASNFLVGEAVDVLSAVRSTNPQTFRIYRTFTDSSNYERLSFESGSSWFEIKAETAGTGQDNMSLVLVPAGTGNFALNGPVKVNEQVSIGTGGGTSTSITISSSAIGIYVGSGVPSVSAAQGSIYLRSDGSSTSTRLYVNTNGSTTWTNFTSAT